MKLASDVELISTSFGGRPLNLVLFRGREIALVDTGLVGTPKHSVIPYLQTFGISPQHLSLIVNTHAHADHFGGNEELWVASGQKSRFAAHRLDQAWIEDPPAETRRAYEPYVALGLMSRDDLENSIAASGHGIKLDWILNGNEVLDLGDGLEIQIVFAPGHTVGNIAILDRKNKILVQGESVAGIAQYNLNGDLLTVPFYEDVETYLRTVAMIARLDFEILVPSHLAPMNRDQAARFLGDSLDFTLRFDQEIKHRLQECNEPVALPKLWKEMDKLWGMYPADLGLYMLLESHLKRLLSRGIVTGSLTGGLAWQGGECEDDLAPVAQEARTAIEETQGQGDTYNLETNT